RLAFGRPAVATEMIRARQYLNEYEKDAFKEGVKDARMAAWASYCQALLASAEFRYVR
ncbi:MAG: hypothetical protein HY289_09090, partial [Planctomycetes bacterium]|nr:hypothetical protein [Planctomycetota bacterium]